MNSDQQKKVAREEIGPEMEKGKKGLRQAGRRGTIDHCTGRGLFYPYRQSTYSRNAKGRIIQ
jgi:hypothetical protein